jgi:hypothetical protein
MAVRSERRSTLRAPARGGVGTPIDHHYSCGGGRAGAARNLPCRQRLPLPIARSVLEVEPSDVQSATDVVYLLVKAASLSSDPAQSLQEALNVLQKLNPLKLTAPLNAVMDAIKEQLGNDSQNRKVNQAEIKP